MPLFQPELTTGLWQNFIPIRPEFLRHALFTAALMMDFFRETGYRGEDVAWSRAIYAAAKPLNEEIGAVFSLVTGQTAMVTAEPDLSIGTYSISLESVPSGEYYEYTAEALLMKAGFRFERVCTEGLNYAVSPLLNVCDAPK